MGVQSMTEQTRTPTTAELLEEARRRLAKALKSGRGVRDAGVAVRELTAALDRETARAEAEALEGASPEERRASLKRSLRQQAARGKAAAGVALAALERDEQPRDVRIVFEHPGSLACIAAELASRGLADAEILSAVHAARAAQDVSGSAETAPGHVAPTPDPSVAPATR